MENDNQPAAQVEGTPPPSQESNPPSDQTPSPEEPILLSKIFPDAQKDLDALFPDPQMKKLLKDVARTQQSNDRFLKRLSLSKIPTDGEDPSLDTP